MKFDNPEILLSCHLLDRVAAAVGGSRKVVFLLGSDATMPHGRSPGVPSSKGIIDLIRQRLPDSDLLPPDAIYHDAFNLLDRFEGQDGVNKLIQDAVLMGRTGPATSLSPERRADDLATLEERFDEWYISQGLGALAALIAHHPKGFGGTVLTTNFDPLIEIALARAAVPWHSTSLHRDGSLLYINGTGTHVVHLHGYWYGSDTLHTNDQLRQPRPQLVASLQKLLGESLVVVLGYGGWEDVIMSSLKQALAGNRDRVDILWTFRSDDETAIRAGSGKVFEALKEAGRRAHFYKGVDIHSFGPALFNRVVADRPAEKVSLFLRRVLVALERPAVYGGLDQPWGMRDDPLGEYVKVMQRFDEKLPARAALSFVTSCYRTSNDSQFIKLRARNNMRGFGSIWNGHSDCWRMRRHRSTSVPL